MSTSAVCGKPEYLGFYDGAFAFGAAPGLSDIECLVLMGISKAESGRIRAQGRFVRPRGSQEFRIIPLRDDAPTAVAPGDSTIRVLYEDDFVIAVDKPAGLLVHGDGTGTRTLSDDVTAHLASRGALMAPQAVHRLDVGTTGVVLFSKAVEFQGLFDALLADHSLAKKRYLAAVQGAYPRSADRIALPLARDRHDAKRMRAVRDGRTQGSQDALTIVERLATNPDGSASLIRATLGTGRKHQIRVHLAATGHPILGDVLYGRSGSAPRLMLHACELAFTHPVTGADVVIEAEVPCEFSLLFPDEATH